MKSHKFVDSATLYAKAGNGGNGCVSFRREKFVPRGGPDGGDGARGGHIIIQADHDESSLIRVYYAPHRNAEDGGHGKGQKLHGRNGKDMIIKVPLGTEIFNQKTGELLADIFEQGEQYIAATGGKGGRGNVHWKTSTHQAPTEHTLGEPGEELVLRLILKLVADVGLVGFPNAGKSSLLRCISDAHPKVGAYPFTTMNPVIGTVVFDDFSRITVADIPGLIEGAHNGVGLGHDFLRHIERSNFLIYVIDMSGMENRLPHEDYNVLRNELEKHKPELIERPCLIAANKMDLPSSGENLEEFIRVTGIKPIEISAANNEGIVELKSAIEKMYRTTAD